MGRRIGILGGTFDPPHNGHLIVASDAYEALGLDRLLLIPAAMSPLKERGPVATAEQRLEMLAAAVRGDRRFAVDDVEIRRGGRSYTIDTLREIAAREAGVEPVLLIGIDQYRDFDAWREPREIARLARLGVLARGGEAPDLSGPYGGMEVPVRRVDISSTEIRERLATGRSVRYLVPEAVAAVIGRDGIYGGS